jgi:hypothetical protein
VKNPYEGSKNFLFELRSLMSPKKSLGASRIEHENAPVCQGAVAKGASGSASFLCNWQLFSEDFSS